MARERSLSQSDVIKEPHLLSLKVVRLSRPSLNQQYPLPLPSTCSTDLPENHILYERSLAFPVGEDPQLTVSPLLTMPAAFNNAYIGESFSCLLSVNNESNSIVRDIKVTAEMQTPSLKQTLELALPEGREDINELQPRDSMQRIARYDLKEEGKHVLGVTIVYTAPGDKPDESVGEGEPTRRIRTFKRLYQFPAQQCLTVKTKAGELPGGRAILEAQLENNGDAPISLEEVHLAPKKGWKVISLNWDKDDVQYRTTPLLKPKDVMQVAFLLGHDPGSTREDDHDAERVSLGQLSIEWRSSCGDRGSLSTGSLTAKRLRRA